MNVYFLIPGDTESKTGGYLYNKHVAAELIKQGVSLSVVNLPGNYPNATARDVAEAERAIQSCKKDSILLVDGLAGASLAALFKKFVGQYTFLYLEHLPVFFESDDVLLQEMEREGLNTVHHVIATSHFCKKTLVEWGIKTAITVIEPAISLPGRKKQYHSRVQKILSVGSMTTRKGHHILAEALSSIREEDWHWTICGEIDETSDYYHHFLQKTKQGGIDHKITLTGPVEESVIREHYEASDLLVSAALSETYGMAVMEALYFGLPVLCPSISPFTDQIEQKNALWFEPGDIQGLAKKLKRTILEPPFYQKIREEVTGRYQSMRSWEEAAAEFVKVMEKFQTTKK